MPIHKEHYSLEHRQNSKPQEISSKNEIWIDGRSYSKKKIGDYWYNLSDMVGSGYSSEVFKGYKKNQANKIYAIKVVNLSKMNQANYELLQNEVKILSILKHPNIIQFHDVYYTQNNCYIVTDFCEGGTLQQFLQKNYQSGYLDNTYKYEYLKQIVQGCRYLSEMNILHRDIKPANVFLSQGRCVIGDFGFAMFLQSKETILKENYRIGSPLYMPPQTLKNNVYSQKTDSFALGVLLFNLFTNTHPYPGANKKQLLEMYEINQQFPIPKISHVNQNARNFIQNLCQMDMNSRFTVWEYSEQNGAKIENEDEQCKKRNSTNDSSNSISSESERTFCEDGYNNYDELQQLQEGKEQINHVNEIQNNNLCQNSQQYERQMNEYFYSFIEQLSNLKTIQRIKLHKLVTYISQNISKNFQSNSKCHGYFQNMCQLNIKIKSFLKMCITIFGWANEISFSHLMQNPHWVNCNQMRSAIEIDQLVQSVDQNIFLLSQINHIANEDKVRLMGILRYKLMQFKYIIILIIKKDLTLCQNIINKSILHPDFSKVYFNPILFQEIQNCLNSLN